MRRWRAGSREQRVSCSPPLRRPAATREYWVAAVPVTFNIVPNGKDAIMGMEYTPAETVFGTVVYRRYTKGWRKPLANVGAGREHRPDPRAAAQGPRRR